MKKNTRSKTCFVLMPFSAPFNEYYAKIYRPAIEEAGFKSLRVDEISAPRPFIEDIVDLIRNSDVILAEITGRNPNVMYEMGMAYAAKTPMVMISQSVSEAPTDLKHQRIVVYDTTQPSWTSKLRSDIKDAIKEAVPDKELLNTKRSTTTKSTRNTGKPWTRHEVKQLQHLAKQNTPTRVIGLKLGRTETSVRTKASDSKISLKPTYKSPYTRRKS